MITRRSITRMNTRIQYSLSLIELRIRIIRILRCRRIPILMLQVSANRQRTRLLRPKPMMANNQFPRKRRRRSRLMTISLRLPSLLLRSARRILTMHVSRRRHRTHLITRIRPRDQLNNNLQQPFRLQIRNTQRITNHMGLLSRLTMNQQRMSNPLQNNSRQTMRRRRHLTNLLVNVRTTRVRFI